MNPKERDPRVYLQDILSAIAKIEEYTAKGKEDFFAGDLVQDGVIRQLSIIGEASAKLPGALRKRHSKIPWKDIIGMRNIIVHDYSEIDLPTIWDTVERGLPPLKQTIQAMLREVTA